jgi:primosomal protein N' (replication factor Y)
VLVEGTSIVRLGPQADRRPLLVEVGRRVLDSGEGAVVVVPEGVDIPRVAAVLRAAGAPVAVLPEAWAVARRGGVVAVGTRRAVWAPLPRVGAMVVLDAHDHSLVEQRRPSWSATTVAIERARRDGAPCVVVSPCPPVAMTVLGRPWRPSRVAERASWPVVEVVDLRTTDPRLGLLTERVTALVRWAVAAEDSRGGGRDGWGGDRAGQGHDGSRQRSGGSGVARRVGLVLNRPGGARLVVCGACRAVARCDACGRALTLVDDAAGQHLRCRWCQGVQPVICVACGSTKVVGRRPGVATLRRHVEALAGVVVTEVAGADPARRPPPDQWTSVVVGTEAMLHGDTGFDAVVLLDIDDGLLAPRLGAGEATLALVARAARAVRRSRVVAPPRRGAGVVVVQTREADHPAVRAAVAGDPDLLVQAELPVRDQLRWPPATAVAVMDGPGAPALADAIVRAAGAGIAIEVSGPLDGRWTLRAPNAAALCDALALRHGVAGRVRIDVDPVDL